MSETNKGKIVSLRKVKNENEVPLGYEVLIEYEEDPNLKLGECEVKNVRKQ